jgi:hypothetical protein
MHRMMPGSVLLGAAALAIFATIAYGQSILGSPSEANHFIETPNGWVHPRTPWGEPDIQATLNMMQAANVPLERCANSYRFGGPPCDMNKKWWTDEEYAQRLATARGRGDLGRELIAKGEFGRALLSGATDPSTPQRQTNLIVHPPSGLLPDLTPEARRRALQMGSSWALPGEDPIYEDPLDFDFWDNCRSRGMPSSMMPYRYNGGFSILQAPGVVVFDLEMIHDSRIIYTDGRPPLSPTHKQYMGDSRGRWEGNTLVIETANYKEGPPMINLAVVGSPAGNRFPVSDRMKTTERITRLNDDTWLYEITTEDPIVLTRPFTVRYPMRNDPTYQWWEYGCHEGNSIVENYSSTNRHEREHPAPEEPARSARVSADVASALAGAWTGRPRIATIDYDIFLEFTRNPDGTVQGKLIGTNLKTFRGRVNPTIDKPLRDFTMKERQMNFELPNTQPWTFAGELSADGTAITGTLNSAQGGMAVTFRRR